MNFCHTWFVFDFILHLYLYFIWQKNVTEPFPVSWLVHWSVGHLVCWTLSSLVPRSVIKTFRFPLCRKPRDVICLPKALSNSFWFPKWIFQSVCKTIMSMISVLVEFIFIKPFFDRPPPPHWKVPNHRGSALDPSNVSPGNEYWAEDNEEIRRQRRDDWR